MAAELGSKEGWRVSLQAASHPSAAPCERASLPTSPLVRRGGALSNAPAACQHIAQGSSPRMVERSTQFQKMPLSQFLMVTCSGYHGTAA